MQKISNEHNSTKIFDIASSYLSENVIVIILQLEKFFKQKFHDLDARFYISKRNMCVHLGLEKSIFCYSNYKETTEKYNKFFKEHLSNKCIVTKLQLIHTASGNSTTKFPGREKNE